MKRSRLHRSSEAAVRAPAVLASAWGPVWLVALLGALACGEPRAGVRAETDSTADAATSRGVVRPQESAWSPDGSQIVFWSIHPDGNVEICSVAPDGSDLRNLTRDPREDGNAVFSPDGGTIAYFSRPQGHGQIFVANPDGSEPRNLSNGRWADYNPTWAPDGRRIAFQSVRDGDSDLYVMNRDGSNVRALTENEAHDTNPAFAPDGRRIAFVSHHADSKQIHLLDLDTGSELQLTRGPGNRRNPKWSPNGAEIVFHIDDEQEGVELGTVMIMRADGSQPRVLVAPKGAYHFNPFFSPDGRWIAFASDRSGEIGLYKVRPDGSEETPIAEGFCHQQPPSTVASADP